MEELKMMLEVLAKMGEGAQMAFIVWCIKEFLIYLICPITFGVVGFIVYKIITFVVIEEEDEIPTGKGK